ncbi:MAG: hypothetical protein ACKVOQ_23125 [Cyclobacteriaceae bacterium]
MNKYRISPANTVIPLLWRGNEGEVFRKYSIILFLILLTSTGFAQINSKTIKWKVESVMDIVKGTVASQFGDVVTRPDKIEVHPSKVTSVQTVQTYVIKKTDTSWTDLEKDGSVLFQVADADKKGTVSIKRINGKLWITLGIFNQSTKTLFDFKCTGYEIISQ